MMQEEMDMSAGYDLPELPFEHFFSYDEVSGFVRDLAAAAPDVVELGSLGVSREGRKIHLLTITNRATGSARAKPAYVIQGNLHAAELSGTHAALYTALHLVADHGAGRQDLLNEVVFYVIPRLNPDGAEFVVSTSGQCRSRTDRSRRRPNTLYQEDVNGDGLILSMRQVHPDGTFAVDPADPRLLIRRTKESRGPYYRVFPEGLVHDWDGSDRISVEGRSFDWNRNWSYDWRPEPEQWGAGDFPFSEPEMRAMAGFLHDRREIFGILGYHTGPNAMLRAPSTGSEDDIDGADLGVMDEIAGIGAKLTGFPLIPVVKYHMVRPGVKDGNLRGHFHNFGYHHLGLFVYEFELGTLVNSAGISTRDVFATRNQAEYEALMRKVLSWWDGQDERRRDPVFQAWTPFEHPQLGPVEIGGLLLRHMAGPTLPELRDIAAKTYRFTLEHAAYRPKVRVEDIGVDELAGGIRRLRLRVANRGQLPTHVSRKGRTLRRMEPVSVDFKAGNGVRLLSWEGHRMLGHLGPLTDSRLLEWFFEVSPEAKTLCELTVRGGTGGTRQVVIGVDGSARINRL